MSAHAARALLRGRITRDQVAFVRGSMQSMALPELAQRYLAGICSEAARDLRVAKPVLKQVLDEVTAAARRAGRNQEAALMRRQAARIR